MTHGGDSILIDSSIGCDPGVAGLSSSFDTWSDFEDTECNIEKTIFSSASREIEHETKYKGRGQQIQS